MMCTHVRGVFNAVRLREIPFPSTGLHKVALVGLGIDVSTSGEATFGRSEEWSRHFWRGVSLLDLQPPQSSGHTQVTVQAKLQCKTWSHF